MGVRFLESYLEKEPRKACYKVDIGRLANEYRQKNGRAPIIVIDGMSCLYPLYGKLSWLNGGQYKEFYDIVLKFVNNFITLGCKLIVFFDGPVQKIKLSCKKKRRLETSEEISALLDSLHRDTGYLERNSRSSCLPKGVGNIFADTISQYEGCQVFTSIEECDEEIALYAKENNCFAILGQDTDYVIYRAAEYYFSAKHLDLDHMTTICYDGFSLSSELGISPNSLPLFASLAGNDIIEFESLRNFHYNLRKRGRSGNLFPLLAEYIRNVGFKSLEDICYDVFGSAEQAEILKKSINTYNPTHWTRNQKWKLEITSKDEHWCRQVEYLMTYISSINAPIYDICVRCEFYSYTYLENYRPNKIIVPIENLMKELRRSIYGILLHEKPYEMGEKEHFVSEFVMTGFDSLEQYIPVKPKYLNKVKHPGLKKLLESKDKEIEELRWEILSEIFECNTVRLKNLPKWMVIPALATRYFKKEYPYINDWELDALLACNVCSRNYTSQDLAKLPSGPLTYRSVWIFTAVSTMYEYLSHLNDCLGKPLSSEYTMAYQYCDGKLFHEKYRQSEKGAKIIRLCEHKVAWLPCFKLIKSFVIS